MCSFNLRVQSLIQHRSWFSSIIYSILVFKVLVFNNEIKDNMVYEIIYLRIFCFFKLIILLDIE